MRRLFQWVTPASLAGRTTLTLLAGLLAFHLGSVWLLQQGLNGVMEEGREQHLAEHLAAARRAVSALPEQVREVAAGALSSASLNIGWQRHPAPIPAAQPTVAPFSARVRQLMPDLAELRLGHIGPPSERRIDGGLRLDDGTWLVFATPALNPMTPPAHALVTSLSAMALGIVLASVLMVRWITNPLRRLAEAAEGFGGEATPVPLREDGPREVRDAARTFNAMQARIHRLVADRTQALAAVSHDLRTPIQRLRLRAGFLADNEAQQAIDADLDEMEAMVESTLAFLRGETESEAPRPTDLAAILRTLCDDATDRGVEVSYAGPDRAVLRLRPVAVKRAFSNLIDNAVKYGGSARVALDDSPAAVMVWVQDDGPGIPEADFETVFEPFQRLEISRNRGTGGTGLGLTVARQVVQAHGGSIVLANRRGGGLMATVRLPRTA